MINKTAEFIEKAIKIHGDRYDYSKVEYIKTSQKVIIICKDHGEFTLTPNKHLSRKDGCKKCSRKIISNKQRSTTESFINKAKEIHGDKYDYSDVNYTNNNTLIKIICKIHGKFSQTPNVHKRGNGCQKCGNNYRYDTKEFIEKANEIHGDKYDYSKTDYKKNNEKVIIICKAHGEFEQKPNNHLTGNGCQKCKFELIGNLKRKTKEDFIFKARENHGDKYDYSLVDYKKGNIKVKIICKIHGEFLQFPSSHLNNCGCNKCSGNYILSKEEFIIKAQEVHGNKFDYSNVNYINNSSIIEIECKKHGLFLQNSYVHLKGHGCKKCVDRGGSQILAAKLFINKAKEIHGDRYDYSMVEYKGSNKKVKIICKTHGCFEKTPDNHLHKKNPQGCMKCQTKNQYSKKQSQWLNSIQLKENITIQHAENEGEFIIPNTNYKADGYCQETNTIYEFHGDYWHGNPNKFILTEINKTTKCSFGELYQKTLDKELVIINMGFNLITMWESEWNKINKNIDIEEIPQWLWNVSE